MPHSAFAPKNVSFDQRALLIDGCRTLILSGAMHYPRSTPAMWPALMKQARRGGLNTIETYVFWNHHERRRGVLDFSDRLDLPRFCRLAQEHGLHVILRIGPYVCAETNYGGLPAWLRELPGVQMRTDNEPFKREMERWVRLVAEIIRPLCAPNGGPIILAQIENEYDNIAATYGDEGRAYLQWAVDLARSLNLGIPWVTCAAGRAAEAGPNDVASADGSLETINTFRAHEVLDAFSQKHPGLPALWTENWVGWYQTWGGLLPKRPAEELAYSTARFFAAGGAGVNYYLWHGGTNFGREGMYLNITSFEFGAPLDEYGLPTTKSAHLAKLNHALLACADRMLASERPSIASAGPAQVVCAYEGGVAFLCNDDEHAAATIRHDGRDHALAPRSVKIIAENGRVLFDSATLPRPVTRAFRTAARLAPFRVWREPLPEEWLAALQTPRVSAKPVEQLSLTRDETDYCWYETTLAVAKSEAGAPRRLQLDGTADIVHVFVDGKLAASTPGPLRERRGLLDGLAFKQSFELALPAGSHRLSLLCCALGLIKGDWMLGYANMAEERKGLWGAARWNGRPLRGAWRMQPGLAGERARVFDAPGCFAPWKPLKKTAARVAPLAWLETTFPRPSARGPFAFDLGAMGKGMVWLNGRCLGRHWLIPESDPMGPWMDWMKRSLVGAPSGVATQRYYHIPSEWLRDQNRLVLFEELGGEPAKIRLVRRV
ncbi:glycoside hydrolase family 35 [Termitidicoccus mucosus]|uniref:Beta-galactosidase n=1 Tax=Termitidicoccus mucosus TaxID=1184151 RepID=A0A178INF3_9BACT|nr:glycoside hydrolase family 35 [Opitutaceae bacterium TSB47]